MFCDFTYQDWENAENKERLIPVIIDRYKSCEDFSKGLDANAYFCGENTEIMAKKVMQPNVIKVQSEEGVKKTLSNKEIIGNRCSNNFLYRFVVQQNQYLLGNGVVLKDEEQKKKLGRAFDTRLQETGESAILHGVAWGYWNYDHLEFIDAAKDEYSGCVGLLDEMTGEPKVVIQFWQIAFNKPMIVRLFEMDGVTVYRFGKGVDAEGKPSKDNYSNLETIEDKRPYKLKTLTDAKGKKVIGGSNYSVNVNGEDRPVLPIVPLFANKEKRSEFTQNIKSKIDVYDRILSDFGDNLDRANDVYWVLNNFGGTTDDVIEMIDQINKIKAVINQSNAVGGGATAEPRTIEVPYAARSAALDILRKSLYQDYMALDMDELRGGSLTNVAIQTAVANLNLKADRYEWQCFDFVQKILYIVGISDEDAEKISFVRQCISNDTEVINNIYTMRDDVSREWALKKNPYINADEIGDIIKQRDQEEEKAQKKAEEAKQREMLIQEATNAVKGANGDELQGQTGQSEQAQGRQEAEEGQVTESKSDKESEQKADEESEEKNQAEEK